MSKKIITVAILMLAIVVVFAACKKDDYEVSYTVPVEDGEAIEVFEDKDGNEFVTNVDGDKIPVTTDKDGFYDDITALITQTTVPTTEGSKDKDKTTANSSGKEEPSESKGNENTEPDNSSTTTEPDNSATTPNNDTSSTTLPDDSTTTPNNDTPSTTLPDNSTTTPNETTTNNLVIGESGGKQDTISWEEIVNAGKK